MIALSPLTLSAVSFAVDVPPITTSLSRPETFQNVIDGVYHTQFSICVYRQDGIFLTPQGIEYALQTFEILSNTSINILFKGARICCSDPIISSTQTNYNLLTGNLISSTTQNYFESSTIGGQDHKYIVSAQPLPQVQNRQVQQYLLDVPSWISDTSIRSNEFVTWAVDPPEQNQYHSPLSEPVADQYNSYAVLDDHLIWVSYRVNAMYTSNNQIESSSQVFSESTSVISSGNGSFTEVGNGYTEDVSVPDGEFVGASQSGSGSTSLITGGYSGYDLGNIDFSSSANGSVNFNSNGTVTYNDVEYKPISFSQSDILSYFRLYCIPTATDNFVFWLAPDRSFSNDILINMDFFLSEFDLDGNYIRSSFHAVTSSDLGLFDSYQSENDISSVRFYGFDFYNLNNIPLNLSSVLWQYDLEFVQWRDSMLNLLQDIYQTLSQDPDVPEAATTANWGNDIKDAEPGTGISSDEVVSVYDNVDEINSSLSSSSEDLHRIIDMFSVSKLIGLVAFALSIGTAIIILGKKKSD